MTDETTRRAQDKFSAAVFRATRLPVSAQIVQEHEADLGALHKQADKALSNRHARNSEEVLP